MDLKRIFMLRRDAAYSAAFVSNEAEKCQKIIRKCDEVQLNEHGKVLLLALLPDTSEST